jgi:hypothetical protein
MLDSVAGLYPIEPSSRRLHMKTDKKKTGTATTARGQRRHTTTKQGAAREGDDAIDISAFNRRNVSLHGPHGWYVAKVGVYFRSVILTVEEDDIVHAAVGRKKFRIRECFHNAQRIVMADKTETLEYVEGFRLHRGFYAHHAWASIHGKVIDPTNSDGVAFTDVHVKYDLRPYSKLIVRGVFGADGMYLGVALSRDVFSRRLGKSTLDDWEHDWPLERELERKTGTSFPRYPIRDATGEPLA